MDGLKGLRRRLDQVHDESRSNLKELVGLCFGLKVGTEEIFTFIRNRSQRVDRQLLAITRQQQQTRSRISTGFQAVLYQLRLLRSIGATLLGNIIPFSEKVLKYLRRNLRINMEIYALLLQIHTNLPERVLVSPQDCISFEDVLGRVVDLPYAYFRHWDVLESMLRCEFSGLPGQQKVLKGDFILINNLLNNIQIDKDTWHRMVFPGSKVRMSAIMNVLRVKVGKCPRPQCSAKASHSSYQSLVRCEACGLNFKIASSLDVEKWRPRIIKTFDASSSHMRQSRDATLFPGWTADRSKTWLPLQMSLSSHDWQDSGKGTQPVDTDGEFEDILAFRTIHIREMLQKPSVPQKPVKEVEISLSNIKRIESATTDALMHHRSANHVTKSFSDISERWEGPPITLKYHAEGIFTTIKDVALEHVDTFIGPSISLAYVSGKDRVHRRHSVVSAVQKSWFRFQECLGLVINGVLSWSFVYD